jgi:nicotinamidase-related amidase
MIANTCINATARLGMELGYHVTLINDATAALSQEIKNLDVQELSCNHLNLNPIYYIL